MRALVLLLLFTACARPAGESHPEPTTPEGVWRLDAIVQSGEDHYDLTIEWNLCPDGTLTGFEWLDDWTFVDEGTWSLVDEEFLVVEYNTFDVETEEVYGPSAGELTWSEGKLCCFGDVAMVRSSGALTRDRCPSE